ncbi:acid protease [Microthyrium microscopicum]|uniref:Acid protease n=1 Tax=Microthyrium microscopicum TaxID=703497 RepID=A0A6A6TWP8_9PEZI|nr:acid protease [Microthyrium microscopicum]
MATSYSLRTLLLVALSLYPESLVAEPGVLGLTFEKRRADPSTLPPSRLRKRASSAQATLYNSQGALLYLVNSTVGTPGQNIGLQLDTGSSDIWVPWAKSTVCTAKGSVCSSGSFDETKSSTFVEYAAGEFQIGYVDGTKIQGDYVNDTFSIAGASIKNMTMGLAKKSSSPNSSGSSPFQGIVGVGFDNGEALYSQSQGQTYPNIISQMVAQNVISVRAYSLWLNDLSATQGNILFGGVDDAKFNGNLVVLPLQVDSDSGIIDTFTVTFSGLEIDGNGGKTVYSVNSTAPVILDSGTSLTYLPDDIANAIIGGVGVINSQNYGYIVDCNVGNTAGIFKFKFGNANGPVIAAKISQFVIPFDPSLGAAPKFKSGATACQWGILPSGEDPNLFGDTFLRSAYVVYNLDANTVALAETNFNVKDTNIKQITASDAIPGATSTASGTAVQTHSGQISQTLGGFTGGASSTVASATSGTFDLGTATSSASSGSGSGGSGKTNGAGQLSPPTAFVGTIFTGVAVLVAMLGGSVMLLV